jgi:hypothetical protein
MPFSSVTDPRLAAVLAAILDDICIDAGIEAGSREREDIAALLMQLYWDGQQTVPELKAALAAKIQGEVRRYG